MVPRRGCSHRHVWVLLSVGRTGQNPAPISESGILNQDAMRPPARSPGGRSFRSFPDGDDLTVIFPPQVEVLARVPCAPSLGPDGEDGMAIAHASPADVPGPIPAMAAPRLAFRAAFARLRRPPRPRDLGADRGHLRRAELDTRAARPRAHPRVSDRAGSDDPGVPRARGHGRP